MVKICFGLTRLRLVSPQHFDHCDDEIFCLDNWTHRLGFESARAAWCKWAACTHQTLSKTFGNSLSMQRQFEKNAWEKSNDTYSLSIRVHTTKNHISICFFTTISMSKKMFFFRAWVWKDIAWHVDASSVVWTLIYHGKLANQIARLPASVVKH